MFLFGRPDVSAHDIGSSAVPTVWAKAVREQALSIFCCLGCLALLLVAVSGDCDK